MPYALVGGTRFYERKEVKDILAYLRVIDNEKDNVSFSRIEKLGKKRLQKFMEFTEKLEKDKFTTIDLLDKTSRGNNYFFMIQKMKLTRQS